MNTGKIMSENCVLIRSNIRSENVVLKFGEKKTQRIVKDHPSDWLVCNLKVKKKMFFLFQGRIEYRFWLMWKNFPIKLITTNTGP